MLLLLAVGLAVGIWVREDPRPGIPWAEREGLDQPHLSLDPVVVSDVNQREETAIATASAEKPTQQTAEEFLLEYWGSEWASLREQALAAGVDFNSLVQPPPRWVDVESEIREMFLLDPAYRETLAIAYLGGIPDPVTADWLASMFATGDLHLDDVLIADVQGIVADHSAEIDNALEVFYAELEFAVRDMWDTGRFLRGPLFVPAGEMVPMCYSSSFAHKGWCVNYVVSTREYPQLLTLSRAITLLVMERDRSVAQFLAKQL